MKKCILLLTSLILPTVFANPALLPISEKIRMSIALGYLNGLSQEFVYELPQGRKISQLDWKIKNNMIIKGEFNYKIKPWLDLNAKGWTILMHGSNVMNDYDWQNPEQKHWTDWSHHKDTDLKDGNEFDINLKIQFLQKSNFLLGALIGYQETYFNFLSKGGQYSYDNAAYVGSFPAGQKGIGYEQLFKAPYIGLQAQYAYDTWEFLGLFKLGIAVNASDKDEHYSRQITFYEESDFADMYAFSLNAGYYIKPQLKLFAEGSFNFFPNNKSDSYIEDITSNGIYWLGADSAGISNKYAIISLGIQYKSN